MTYALITALLLFVAVLVVGCQKESAKQGGGTTGAVMARNVSGVEGTRAALERRLRELARAPAPENLSMGAMCYEMEIQPLRTEYVCVDCGERTLYASDGDEVQQRVVQFLNWYLEACRRVAAQIVNLHVMLDESSFCHACSPDETDPRLVLEVSYPDGTIQKTVGVGEQDLRLLRDLMSGSDRVTGEQEQETPLKDQLPRLEQLLGISLDEDGSRER